MSALDDHLPDKHARKSQVDNSGEKSQGGMNKVTDQGTVDTEADQSKKSQISRTAVAKQAGRWYKERQKVLQKKSIDSFVVELGSVVVQEVVLKKLE